MVPLQSFIHDQDPTRRTEWTVLAICLVAAATLRYAAAFELGLANVTSDTRSYIRMAEAILASEPVSAFPNGLPLLIAGYIRFFGSDSVVPTFLWLNVAIGTATAFLIYRVCRDIFSWPVAVLALVLVSFWPNQINCARWVMTEIFAAFLLAAAIFLCLRSRYVLTGVCLGIAVMFRSTMLIPAATILAVVAWQGGGRAFLRCAGGLLVIEAMNFALVAGGVIAPTANFRANLLISIQSHSTEGINYDVSGFSDDELAGALGIYMFFALAEPRDFLMQRLASLWEFLGPWPAAETGGGESRSPIRRLLIGMRFPVFLLAFIAPFILRDGRVLYLVLPIASLALLHTAFFSVSRFSAAIEPLAIAAASALTVHVWYGYLWRSRH